jgi:hypothetical protein
MARLRDMNKEEMFGGKRGSKSSNEEQPVDYKALQAEVDQVDKDINELRSTYELYFMGAEKMEPINQRDLIKAQIRRWKEMPIKNTALRFQMQQLKARMVSLENYWQRILKQKEDGTYSRDVARAKRREAERLQEEAKKAAKLAEKNGKPGDARAATMMGGGAGVSADGRPITGADLHAGRSASETAGRGGPKAAAAGPADMARPSASSADDLTEPKLRKLYQTYVGARKRCGEPVDLRYEDMAAALRKQVPKLMKETGAKAVEFKIVIRNGRAVLKALPKH